MKLPTLVLISLIGIRSIVFAENIKSDSSDFSIKVTSSKGAMIISPENTTLPVFFSPQGNPTIVVPPAFPYRVVVQQEPNPTTLTSISMVTAKMTLVDVIFIGESGKISFAPRSLVSEMQKSPVPAQEAEQGAAANP